MTPLPPPPHSPDGMRPPRLPVALIPALLVAVLAASAAGLVAYAWQERSELESRLAFGVARAQRAVTEWERIELERASRWSEEPAVVAATGTIPTPLAALARHTGGADGLRAVALFSPHGALVASSAPELLTDPMLGQRVAAIQRARAGTPSVAGPIWPSASRDGSDAARWLLISATPVRDPAGRITAVLAFFHEPDAPLRRVRFATRADSAPDLYLIDEKGALLSGSGPTFGPAAGPAAPTASTPTGDRAEGMVLQPYVGPAGQAVVGAWAPAAPLAARVVFEIDARPASALLPLPLGYLLAALLVVAIGLVLVQQRGMARLRRESRAWRGELEVVVESAPNAVIVTDERGQVVRVNRRAVVLLDAPAPSLVGTSIDRWLRNGKPFHPDRLVPWLEGVGRDGKARRADGDETPVEVRVGSGEAEGRRIHIVVLLDRAAQQGAEQAIRDARQESERTRQARTEFLSSMSEGIRTPMSRVMGMAHLLNDTSLSTVQQGYVESLMRASQMMMSFVTDVLDLSKMESGALQLIEAPFDARAAVQEVAALIGAQAEGNATVIETRIHEKTPGWVVGDAARFRQVLINLVGNGIKFAPGGRVEIRLEGKRDDTDVQLKVEVRDNGPGMDAETQRRLLAKDHTTVSKLAGGGLGISMAKHLSELMRGKLEVKSLQGEGTTFKFTLTLKAAEGVSAPDSEHTASLAGRRALLVDSSSGEMQVTREFMRSFGLRVETTTTPEEAIGHLRRAAADGDPVEVALVDRQTVGEAGDAFARRLRAEPAIAGVGLLLAAAATSSAEAERLGLAGFDATLSKPFGAQALSRTLAAVVQRAPEERGRGPIIRGETLSALLKSTPRPLSERPDGHIPVVDETHPRRPAEAEPVDTRLRVLLAEDNRVNQIVATNLLQRMGCRVEVVGDGAEAVRQASRHEFEVIFMDIQMPNMDGLAATRMIRQLEGSHGRAHIIALGTSASPEERDRYLAAGIDDVVVKPITPEGIQGALERRPAGMERLTPV